jgi:predicted MFS family arabinose efflux permease
MAISLALNGASFGGIMGVPLLVAAIGGLGFSGAMIAAATTMLVVMIPVILIFVGPPPNRSGIAAEQAAADAPSASQLRARAFRDVAFLTIAIAFALVLFAQVGFIVHLIAFLDPVIGRERAATAVALLTAMAVVGRVLFSTVIDRLNQRLASAISFASQAVALLIVINSRNEMLLLAACALFGFSVGNLITLPSLIVQREFGSRAFGVLISLITAINQITYAFGPGVIGLLRDASGSYALPFYVCIGLELVAATLIMIRGGGERSEAIHIKRLDCFVAPLLAMTENYVSRARNRSSRSSRRVNIASEPSGLRGHCSLGRSKYSSTPFWSGSRR